MTQRKCGICGEEGHNARTCPHGGIKEEAQEAKPDKVNHRTLIRAMHAAQAMADRIGKDSHNDFSRYDYTSAEAQMEMWTAISEIHGLALIPTGHKLTAGDPMILTSKWNLCHISGDNQPVKADWPCVPGKGKPMDKAVASARTSALGYLIRDLLIAPRVNPTDDMDHPKWSEPTRQPVKDDLSEFWSAVESFGHSRATINGYCLMRGAKMPADMDQSEHTRMLEWLMGPKGRAAISEYTNNNQ